MNQVIYMLLAFVALGLLSHRLAKYRYVIMGLVILAYIAYAFNK